MKRIAMLLGAGILLLSSIAYAAVPQLINFQGVLRDGSGNPVANGSYSVQFTIYDAPSAGNIKWQETQSVTTSGGLFTVLLGSTSPVPDSAFNNPNCYLGVKVGTDPEMTPRQQLASTPYSYRVDNEPGVASSTFDGTGGGGISLVFGVETLASRTINVPAAGYVLVLGSFWAHVNHTGGQFSQAYFGVSNDADSFPPNQDLNIFVSFLLPTGFYSQPVTVHGLFPVAAGANTFYLLGQLQSGGFNIYDIQFTLVYLPAAYGTVEPTLAAGAAPNLQDLGAQSSSHVLTATEIATEQIQRELTQVKAEMEALKREVREQNQQIDE